MSDKVTIKLVGPEQRQRAYQALLRAPADYVVTIREPNRTLDQNAKMHAMLSDVARAEPQGRKLPTEVWKALFMHDAGFKCSFEHTLDGSGVVPLGFKSSHLSKAEFSDLIEAIYAFGSEHGVTWSEPEAVQ